MENKTSMMLVYEISKLFDEMVSKHPDNIFANEKTPRLILMILSQNDGISQSELVKSTHMKGSTISIAISKLEETGYIARENNPYDMRSVRVYLTEKGRQLNARIKEIIRDTEIKIMEGISAREQRAASFILNSMLENLKKFK